MPSFLDQQIQGKYKGVPFYTRSERKKAGQSRVKHTYPKSGVQYHEPMGIEPFSGPMEIFFAGENYRDDYAKFERAVNDPAPGRLYMPTFGVFNNVICLPFEAEASQNSLGEIKISVTFEQTTERPAPTDTSITEQDVNEKAQEARNTLQESFAESYTPPTELNNIETAISDSKELADQVKKITGKVRDVRNFVRKVDGAIRSVERYAALLLNEGNPLGFLQSIALGIQNTAGYAIFKQLATTGTTLPNSMNDIKSGVIPVQSAYIPNPTPPRSNAIDTTIKLWDNDTAERQARNANRITLVMTFRLAGLISMFESAAAQTYTTTEQIDTVVSELNRYYEALVTNSIYAEVVPFMKNVLAELKNRTFSVLDIKRQQSFTVIEIRIPRPMSGTLLAYELYGEYIQNEAQLNFMRDILIGLNRQQPAYRLNGIVKAVEIG